MNSKCATEYEQKKFLYYLLGNKKLVTTLLFRGSDDGWKNIDFHPRCDNKGPTICLLKIDSGECIGGFTRTKWSTPPDSGRAKPVCDIDSMLFNLSCYRYFPNKI